MSVMRMSQAISGQHVGGGQCGYEITPMITFLTTHRDNKCGIMTTGPCLSTGAAYRRCGRATIFP